MGRFLLLNIIRLYWLLIPEKYRNVCLFRESCSNYVYRNVLEHGLRKGLNAFSYRYNNCRHPYRLVKYQDEVYLHLNTGEILKETEINPIILNEKS